MDKTHPPPLRLVGDEEAAADIVEPAVEDYWTQVQALRADLAALRHAN